MSLILVGAYGARAQECSGKITMNVHIDCPPCKDFKGCKPADSNGNKLSDAQLRRVGGTCQWTYKPGPSHPGCAIDFTVVYFKTNTAGQWVHPETDLPSECKQGDRNVVPCMTANSCAVPALEEPVVPPLLAELVKQCCADCAKPACLCGCSAWTKQGKNRPGGGWSCNDRGSYLEDVVNVDALPACSCSKSCAFDPTVCKNPPTAECVKLTCEKNKRGGTDCREEKICAGKARDGTSCCEVNKEECSKDAACLPEECRGEDVCTEQGCYSSGCVKDPALCCQFEKCVKHPACAEQVSTACQSMSPKDRAVLPECMALP